MADAPAPPPRDDKNWTWVLEEVCPECGVDVRSFPLEDVGTMIRENATAWAAVLGGDGGEVRARPDADHWSALEYGCHVRDVYRLYDERLRLMLTEDGPVYPDWDQNETAVTDRYDRQDPAVVATELTEAAAALADRFDGVAGDQWDRTGTRRDGSAFTVATFARYLIHDPVHHLWDVRHLTGS